MAMKHTAFQVRSTRRRLAVGIASIFRCGRSVIAVRNVIHTRGDNLAADSRHYIKGISAAFDISFGKLRGFAQQLLMVGLRIRWWLLTLRRLPSSFANLLLKRKVNRERRSGQRVC